MKIYSDKLVSVRTPQNPAVKGHLQVEVAGSRSFEQLSVDAAHVLSAASFASNMLFESIGAQGSNIIISDMDGLHIDILARVPDDGLDFQWAPKQFPAEELDSLAAKIKDKCDYIGVEKSRQETIQNTAKLDNEKQVNTRNEAENTPSGSEKEEKSKTKNYLLRQLDRLP